MPQISGPLPQEALSSTGLRPQLAGLALEFALFLKNNQSLPDLPSSSSLQPPVSNLTDAPLPLA